MVLNSVVCNYGTCDFYLLSGMLGYNNSQCKDQMSTCVRACADQMV